jgi:myosin protein heavy chain
LERQLHAAHARYEKFEDMTVGHQREKEQNERQLKTTREELQVQSSKRAELEKLCSTQKAELAKLKDRHVKLDRELNKALTDLKNREWEIKQLESKQDKTIVEHVHVLEEAKRVTDRQLAEAQLELQKNQTYIRTLEKTKGRLMMEAEDLARATEKERLEIRSQEKNIKLQEERAARALADVETEREARDTAALEAQRLRSELDNSRNQASEMAEQLAFVQRTKDNLESELERLADESVASDSLSKVQRQYESRITQLEEQLEEAGMAKATAAKIRENIERQHAEIRRLIMQNTPRDGEFQHRLLQELKTVDSMLEKEMLRKTPRRSGAHEMHNLNNLTTPTKKKSPPSAPTTPTVDREAQQARANSERQVAALKQHVQVLELQMAASDRVRHHLEISLKELSAELENSDGSKQFLQQYRARLTQENARLAELLKDEADARRTAEAAQVEGIQAMWAKFQKTIASERDSYARLEESRKALVRNGCLLQP